jgi:glutathione S-transferase
MNRAVDVATSLAVTIARLPSGLSVGTLGKRPAEPLRLYEFEACPFCRKVREALSILDLEADILPCPKSGLRYRPEASRLGGKAQFPYLVDPNTGKSMYESDEIVRYLFKEYGDGRVPMALALGSLTNVSAAIAGAFRVGRGAFYESAKAPEKPLELWSFEASPYCRIVREKLCTLELPYRLHNVAKNSPSRDAFVARSGKMMVPYLVDPNTNVEMFESADIVEYLHRTYAQ